MEELQGQYQKVVEHIKIICSLYSDALACRSPAMNYALFLLERYLLLKVKAIRVGHPFEFKSTPDFIKCCQKD